MTTQCPKGTHDIGSNPLCPKCIYENMQVDSMVATIIEAANQNERNAQERAKEKSE